MKELAHPKFYFFDCGVVRSIQKLLRDKSSSEERGILFETFIFNELNAYKSYRGIGGDLYYWRTHDGIEIDFIWKRAKHIIAIEVKSAIKWKDQYNSGFNSLLSSKLAPIHCFGVYCGNETLKNDFGFVLPWQEFLKKLYAGDILPS